MSIFNAQLFNARAFLAKLFVRTGGAPPVPDDVGGGSPGPGWELNPPPASKAKADRATAKKQSRDVVRETLAKSAAADAEADDEEIILLTLGITA